MNNRFWGVWKAGEANTLILSSLGSASRVTLSFSCLFFFFFQSLALLAPLCPMGTPGSQPVDPQQAGGTGCQKSTYRMGS